MRIAQVAPLHEAVPPRLYGGTERVVSYLTEALTAMGHHVTLYASADSATAAHLLPCCEKALRLDPVCTDRLPYHVLQLERLLQRWDQYDVIHFHTEHLHLPLARRSRIATLTTLHGRLDLREAAAVLGEFSDVPVASISDAQRRPLPHLNWQGTVHHGLPPGLYPFRARPEGRYLAFLGRISPEKRPDRAIAIAHRSGIPLRIAAKIDRADADYFAQVIAPMIDGKHVQLIGEVGEKEKAAFLGNALALLLPIDWPEPFGLVMIEAMACGTPVIAWPGGSVPEIIEDGVTGFVVTSLDEAVAAVGRVGALSRQGCRRTFERRFGAWRMARDYLRIYRALKWNGAMPLRPVHTPGAGDELTA